jgi:putative transposase
VDGRRPLQALREEIKERLSESWRTVRLRLLPSESGHESLMDIGLTCARLFNEHNYEKRQAFFKGELKKRKNYEINSKYYYKYNEVLGVNAQAAIQKNDEAWKAFYEQLDQKKQGRLPLLGRSLHQAIGRIGLPMRRRYIYPLEAIDST